MHPFRLFAVFFLFALGRTADLVRAVDPIEPGAMLFSQLCAECHGERGQGVPDRYEEPLVGDFSIAELTELISETMPAEDPEQCVGDDAAAVAAFVHRNFYGPEAPIQTQTPRLRLARLTAQQLRQSIADLYAHFWSPPWTTKDRGISARYFTGARWNEDKLMIKRVDQGIDFDFSTYGPGDEIDPTDYYISWDGGLLAKHTGRYELILKTTCASRMWLGQHSRVLVDNNVQSEGKVEFRRTIQLTAGRVYPLRLEVFQRPRKTKQPAVVVSLSWIPPSGVEQVVPTQNLIPSGFPPAYPLQATLPPDDRTYGYPRGISVDRAWDQSTTNAALEFAEVAINELSPQYSRRHGGDERGSREVLKEFLSELVETAFRGSTDAITREAYIDRSFERTEDDTEVIRRVVLMTLKSPRFLYPQLDANLSPSRHAANRLALILFDSLPADSWLIELAERGELATEQQIQQAAWRMVGDFRCRAKTRAMLYHWLALSDIRDLHKDNEVFEGFDAELVLQLRDSLDTFLDEVVWSQSSDFRQLLQADRMPTNDRLAEFYGTAWLAEGETGNGESLPNSVRDRKVHVGVITHPLVMSKHAYHRTSSPIHRGVFLSRNLLGLLIRPPPDAFTPLSPDLHPELTTRQRVELQTGDANCQACHKRINALGFTLESFDAAGRIRSVDNGRQVNSSGGYRSRAGQFVSFANARELGDFLAQSRDCHQAFVETAFEHFVKQPIAAFGESTANELAESFRHSGYDVQQLIVSIATVAANTSLDEVEATARGIAASVDGEPY